MGAISRRLVLAAALTAALAGVAHAAPSDALPSDMTMGDAKAKIHVIEYASLSCPHCANFNNSVFPAFKAKYVDTGKVRYTLREYLTSPAEMALAGFVLARCAGPARYFSVVDGMFRGQALWQTGVPFTQVLNKVAAANGVDKARLDACTADGAAREAVNARHARAVADGVRSTPTFFVNGKQIGSGELTLAELEAAVAAAGKK